VSEDLQAYDVAEAFSGPFFVSIANSSPDCIRVLNQRGEVVFMNERGRRLFEIEHLSRNLGRYWPSHWPEEGAVLAHEAVQTALGGHAATFRAYCPTAKGAPKWWDNVVSPVWSRDGHQLIGLLATSRDVTAELDAGAFLDAVIESSPASIFVKDAADGRYLLVNRATEQAFGVAREEMLGKTNYDLVPKEQADFFSSRDQLAIESGEVELIEEEPATVNGDLRWFRTKKVAIHGPAGPRYLVCSSEDITERREAAESLRAALARAESANRAKSEFLANMSHEIRTPLNGVVGVADVLARTALDPSQAEMVRVIRDSGQTLARLLSDILDLSRIESGRVELERAPMRPADCARAAAALVDLRCHEKDVRLEIEIAPEAEGWVVGDPLRLKQVLGNLMSNAVKFTDHGEVRLSVAPAPGGFRFEVKDTGVGFDPTVKEQIFGRFQQADGSITRRFGGSGLGLAISLQLAELMGGDLDCDSAPGRGSTFHVTLPFPPADAPSAAAAAPHELAEAQPLPVHVLLADDHPTNRKVVELILSQVGVELTEAEDGRQALEAFASRRFDLVLMDMQMPVMDGLSATRAIRAQEAASGARRTPVVMLTANALPEHVRASLEAGADRHLSKPIAAEALIRTLVEMVEDAAEPAALTA
jgi:PAS domain S-box-containing protein